MTPSFLSFTDQALYLAHIAGGQHAVMQMLLRYHRPIDLDALTRFSEHLAHGPLARLVRPALLPFGRHQWVGVSSPPALAVAVTPLPPEALMAWADAQVNLPLDPTNGPGWTLNVQPLTDGSTVVSMVVSHCIADGTASAIAVSEAVCGKRRSSIYPHQPAHLSPKSLVDEFLRALQDAPMTLRALGQLIRSGYSSFAHKRSVVAPPAATKTGDQTVVFPSVFVRVPSDLWEAKTSCLNIRRMTLLVALTGAFAERLGRVRDGEVSVLIPVNQRDGLSDNNANCVSIASLKVPVDELRGHWQKLQKRIKIALKRNLHEPNLLAALSPLVPFVPKSVFSSASGMALSTLGDLPVTCSNMGNLPAEMLRIDGAPSDRFCFRGVDRQVTVRAIEARQGVASLITGFMPGYVLLNFIAYQPGGITQTGQLQTLASELLATYDLSGEWFNA